MVDASLFQNEMYMLFNDIAGSLVSGLDREKVAREEVVNPLAGYYETQDQPSADAHFRLGSLPWEATSKSMRLFTAKVAPEFAASV